MLVGVCVARHPRRVFSVLITPQKESSGLANRIQDSIGAFAFRERCQGRKQAMLALQETRPEKKRPCCGENSKKKKKKK